MKKRSIIPATLIAGLFILSAGHRAQADAIVTMQGRRIEGRIIVEDADSLQIESPRYGQLRFFKRNLKSVERGEPVAATPQAPATEAAASTPADDSPFGGFGAAPAAPAPPPPSDANPFASGAPIAPAAPAPVANDPFGAPPAPPPPPPPMGAPGRAAFAGYGVPVGSAPAPANNSPFGAPVGAPTADSFATAPASAAPADPFGAPAEEVTAAPVAPIADTAAAPPSASMNVDDIAGYGSSTAVVATKNESAAGEAASPTETPAGPPVVKMGFDGVIHGISEKTPVEARSSESEKWTPTQQDIQFRAGQELRTGTTKSVRAIFRGKKDDLRIADQSTLVVEKLSADLDQVTLNVSRGCVWGEIDPRKAADAYIVRTPELTATIHGTRFAIDRIQGATRVTALAGSINVRADLTSVNATVNQGQSAVVNSLGQILEIAPADDATLGRWDAWDGSSEPQTSALTKVIAQDNEKRDADMRDFEKNMKGADYQAKLTQYAHAFEKFASDTHQIPKDQNGWSALRYDTGLQGWQGPYIEGPIPPVDPWRRALIYKEVKSPTGRVLGRVYSLWQDGRDQGGENPSVDKVAMVMYYNLDAFKDDPNVNPPQK